MRMSTTGYVSMTCQLPSPACQCSSVMILWAQSKPFVAIVDLCLVLTEESGSSSGAHPLLQWPRLWGPLPLWCHTTGGGVSRLLHRRWEAVSHRSSSEASVNVSVTLDFAWTGSCTLLLKFELMHTSSWESGMVPFANVLTIVIFSEGEGNLRNNKKQ